MRVFSCPNCKLPIYFENISCGNCGMALGFDPELLTMRTLAPGNDGRLATVSAPGMLKIYCKNYSSNICNWLVPLENPEALCPSCALNRTIPDLSQPGNSKAWFEIEKAKRRLIYTLRKLGLPLQPPPGSNAPPLAFNIVAGAKTAHDNGLITINIAEADPATREQTRVAFNEPYRTLLGHCRHESGHYYWMLLVNNDKWIERYRALFGDERPDYNQALATYHANGPKEGWQNTHISAYATAHSWEDWAETWAHYLHMVDVLETADSFRVRPKFLNGSGSFGFRFTSFDPYRARSANRLIERWLPLAIALNNLNRSMGLMDFYPFVLPEAAKQKLEFVRQVIAAKDY